MPKKIAALIKGLSHFTGKGGFDLQKEVVVIPIAIGHSLDDLDPVVHSFQDRGVESIACTRDNPFHVVLQPSGKDLYRL